MRKHARDDPPAHNGPRRARYYLAARYRRESLERGRRRSSQLRPRPYQSTVSGPSAQRHSRRTRNGNLARYVHRLLETSGASFSERVNELRLQQAFMLLTEEPPRRISDVALQVGFSDISHFNRLFRSRFGDTPRGVRGQLRQ